MKNRKKLGVSIFIAVLLSVSVFGMSACESADKKMSQDTVVSTDDNQEEETEKTEKTEEITTELAQDTENEIPEMAMEARPSMAPAKMTANGVEIEPVWYDYWYYSYFDSYYNSGIIPLDEQGEPDLTALSGRVDGETWEDILDTWTMEMIKQGLILKERANLNNTILDDNAKDEIERFFQDAEEAAAQLGTSVDILLQSTYGELANKAAIHEIMEDYHIFSIEANLLLESFEYADDEVKEFFDENQELFGDWDIPIVRHILFGAEDGVSEDEDASAKTAAEEVLAQIDAGEDMETLGNALQAEGKVMETAEYDVPKGQMVPEFEDWCYDKTRKENDTGIVKTTYGYHVMKITSLNQANRVRLYMQDEAYNIFMEEENALPQYEIVVER